MQMGLKDLCKGLLARFIVHVTYSLQVLSFNFYCIYLLTRIKYHFVKIQDMDEILCRTLFLRSFNVLVCLDSIDYFL